MFMEHHNHYYNIIKIREAGGSSLPTYAQATYKAPTLCFDLMEMVGKQVEEVRAKQQHKVKMLDVLDDIEWTGGWHNWHHDDDQEPPIEWLIYNVEWGAEIVDNNPAGAFWLWELLAAEIVNYEFKDMGLEPYDV
jgi:hypothetical protein